jgi:hypothetical protein
LAPNRVADASGLFNLMRNLGGGIGLALIDTVIYGRSPVYAARNVEKLKAGDIATGRLIGLPEGSLSGMAPKHLNPETVPLVRALVEKTSLVLSVNEAWAMLAAFSGLAVLSVLLLRPAPSGSFPTENPTRTRKGKFESASHHTLGLRDLVDAIIGPEKRRLDLPPLLYPKTRSMRA